MYTMYEHVEIYTCTYLRLKHVDDSSCLFYQAFNSKKALRALHTGLSLKDKRETQQRLEYRQRALLSSRRRRKEKEQQEQHEKQKQQKKHDQKELRKKQAITQQAGQHDTCGEHIAHVTTVKAGTASGTAVAISAAPAAEPLLIPPDVKVRVRRSWSAKRSK